jgi:hypothetical protein
MALSVRVPWSRQSACVLVFGMLTMFRQDAWAVECKGMPAPALRVGAVHEDIRHDPDIAFADLARIAKEIGDDAHPLLGVSSSEVGYQVEIETAVEESGKATHCAFPVSVEVRLGVISRSIRIVREARDDACLYALAMDHHRHHAEVDDRTLDELTPRIADQIRASLLHLKPTVRSTRITAEAAAKAEVVALVRNAGRALHLALLDAKHAVDTPEELSRLRHECEGRGSSLGKRPI